MINAVTTVIDLIWLISIGGIWTTEIDKNTAWNRRHGIHVFAIICSVFEMVLKVNKKKKEKKNSPK